jgi:hypothetical protein
MRIIYVLSIIVVFSLSACLNLEEEPIVQINPTADISAHIKNQKIFATALINVNSQVLFVGNIPTIYEFSGELSIYDTDNGNEIDLITFEGGGLSQAYTVSADTTARDRFVVVASGTINAFADIDNDGDRSNDKLISTGAFYEEAQFLVNELVNPD